MSLHAFQGALDSAHRIKNIARFPPLDGIKTAQLCAIGPLLHLTESLLSLRWSEPGLLEQEDLGVIPTVAVTAGLLK